MEFAESVTKQNVLRAFAGESQARNRYTFAAEQMKKQQLNVLEGIFRFTADQEKEHAQLFYNLLKQVNEENIPINATYPVGNYDDPLQLLRSAAHNEQQEFEVEYKQFADDARNEGFEPISTLFLDIAEIEKSHGNRFTQFADLYEQNRLFQASAACVWLCLNCGHLHFAPAAPERCPVCLHAQGYFMRKPS